MSVLYMTVGLPGSGKSFFCEEMKEKGFQIHSSDAIRKELLGDESDQSHPEEVFDLLHRRIKEDLLAGKNVVYDACNISGKRRRGFLKSLSNIPCEKRCAVFATPIEQCIENDKQRDRTVGEDVIYGMFTHWDTPHRMEGWDKIELRYFQNKLPEKEPESFLETVKDFNQDNPHHLETLEEHCRTFAENVRFVYPQDKVLYYAGLLHDCGKPVTKKMGEDGVAHYHNHEHTGAYLSLFYKYPDGISPLTVSVRIGLHMRMYSWPDKADITYTKVQNRFLNDWGRKIYNDIEFMYQIDQMCSKGIEEIEEEKE